MKRPLIVTVIGVLLAAGAVLQLGLGALVIAKHNDTDFLEEASVSASHAWAVGLVLIGLGAFSLLLAIGLFTGSRAARDLIGVGQVLQIAAGIYGVATLDEAQRPGAFGTVIGAVVVLYMLFGTDKAKEYYAKS